MSFKVSDYTEWITKIITQYFDPFVLKIFVCTAAQYKSIRTRIYSLSLVLGRNYLLFL